MGKRDLIGGGGFELIDVGGSFKRFLQTAPKETRAYMADAVQKTAFALQQRMKVAAPVGPDAPHIRDAVTMKGRGLSYQVGFIDATEPAAPGNPTTQAFVALLNEYTPNQQPFMRPSAEAESGEFVRRVTAAMQQVDRVLSGGGLM